MAPRKAKKTKPPRVVVDADYRRCAAEWRKRRNEPERGAANWMLDAADLSVDPAALARTLRVLDEVTQDRVFSAARSALFKYDLVDGKGRWKRYAILANQSARDLCEDIESMIANNVSKRQALAEAVVKWSIEAASFDAAHKRLTRLLDEYRKFVGQEPG